MRAERGDEGFALIVLIVAIFIMLLVLGIAAPSVARDLQREKELEAVHRGNQYVRAIQLYYRKFNHYPTTVDQLEKSNNIRFLRRKYEDPLTGKPDWRIIHAGENKTTVKGLFGVPLAGIGTSLGGSSIGGSQTISGTSTPGAFGAGGSTGSTGSSFGSSSIGGGTQTVGGTSGDGSSGVGSQSAATFQGGGGPIMGIGSSKTGESIITLNEQNNYEDWEFLYDPRIEQLKQKSSLLGGGVGNSGGGSGMGSGFGTPGSGIGGSTGSTGSTGGFGSGFGSPTTPSTPTTTPQ